MNLELALAAAAPEDRPYTVTELVEGARDTINQLPPVWIEGEVSGFKEWSSGHWYFTLKDRTSAIACMVWSQDARRLAEAPEEGMKVYAQGRLSVYTEKGQLRFTIKQLLPRPEGGFHALKVERARKALEKDGLLDPARKRRLPVFPSRVGVVTSAEGAAWTDIVAVVTRRWPCCELILIATQVQGDNAPRAIIRALSVANRFEGLDVLIVGRGGGSKEDLIAFNDEAVARAVAGSRVPTISAVGHEIDTTLTDLVADLRVPTPSAAAEAAVPDRLELLRHLDGLRTHLGQAAGGRVESAGLRLAAAGSRMEGAVTRRVQDAGHRLRAAVRSMGTSCASRLAKQSALADQYGASLDALSPLKVLGRGYAVARAEDGQVLRTVGDLPAGRAFRLRVTDGEVPARSEAGS